MKSVSAAHRNVADGSEFAEPASATTTLVPNPGGHDRRAKSTAAVFLRGEIVAGRFEILRPLGQGGMGQVFAAADLELGGTLALKVVRPDLAARPEIVAQLRREVKLARMVTHPNVCRIYDVTQHEDRPADGSPSAPMLLLTMELLDGSTLQDRLAQKGRLPVADALILLRQMAAALESAHRVGVVHRDFKPGNVLLLEDGGELRAVVTDFGVAALCPTGDDPKTQPSAQETDRDGNDRIAGTPAYLAPEERLGSSSFAGDLYSFGVVAAECLTGRRPALRSPVVSLGVEGLDAEAESLLLRCLTLDPATRPTAASVVESLDRQVGAVAQGVEVLVRLARADPERVAAIAREFGGRVLSTSDDSPLVAAGGPSEALPLAFRLIEHTASGAAVHLGATSGGDTDEIAARNTVAALASLARPGQVLLSRGVSDLIRESTRPAESLRWRSHGLYSLAGLERPLEIFEVGAEDGGAFEAPRDSAAARRVLSPATIYGWRPAVGSELPGRRHWRIIRKLGAGGFGDVWLIAHGKTRERRVLKFCYDRERLVGLQREVTLFRFLLEELGNRDDITRVIDWNLDEEPYFIEAEYTAGGNLLDWLESAGGVEKVDRQVRRELVAQVAEALSAAHSVGVLHRDVKPANILVQPDRAGRPQIRLTDFGIGHVTDQDRLGAAGITVLGMTQLGEARSSAGTRLYQAPELLEGRVPTVQADVYALGVLLFQLEVGDLSRSLSAGWERHVEDPLLVEDIADAVDGLPSRRPTAQQLADRLRSLEERRQERDENRRLRDEAAASRLALARGRQRRRVALLVVATLLAVATALGLLARRASEEARRARDTARAAVAGEWLDRDPTRAALALLELEEPKRTPRATSRARELLGHNLAWREFRGHEGAVGDLVFDPNGRYIATAGYADWTLRVWPLSGDRAAVVLSGHTDGIQHVYASPDGSRLLSVSPDRTARIWPADGQGEPVILRGHEHRVWSAAFSPDGRRVVTASADGTARIWSVETGEPSAVLRGHEGWVFHAAFSADGRKIVTSSQDHTLRIWNVDGETEGGSIVLRGHDNWIFSSSFADQGRRILSTSRDGTVREWDLDGTPHGIVLQTAGPLYRTTSSADGRWRLADSAHGAAFLWPADRSREPRVVRGTGGKTLVAFGQEGRSFAVGFEDGTIHVYRTEDDGEKPVAVLRGHSGAIKWLRYSPDNRWLASASDDGTARLWSPTGPTNPQLGSARSSVSSLALLGGTRLAAGGADGGTQLWRLDEASGQRILEGHRAEVRTLAAAPDGGLFATGSVDDTIGLWTSDGRFLGRLVGHRDSVISLAFDPRNGDLISASLEGTVLRWPVGGVGQEPEDLAAVEPEIVLDELDYIRSVAVHFEQEAVVVIDKLGRLKVYPLRGFGAGDDRRGTTLPGDKDHRAVVVDAARDLIFAGRSDGSLATWRLDWPERRATLLREIPAHTDRVTTLAVGCHGGRLLSGSWDGTARVWESTLERVAAPLELLGTHVTSATCDPDSDLVIVGASTGAIQEWRVDEPDPLQTLKDATQVCLAPDFRQRVLGDSPDVALERWQDCESQPATLPSPPAAAAGE